MTSLIIALIGYSQTWFIFSTNQHRTAFLNLATRDQCIHKPSDVRQTLCYQHDLPHYEMKLGHLLKQTNDSREAEAVPGMDAIFTCQWIKVITHL